MTYFRHHSLLVKLPVLALLLAARFTYAADDPVEEQLRKDVTFLASKECEGRGVSTKGINKAADYIVETFKKAGLKPGNAKDKSYFQEFSMGGPARLGSPNTLVLRGPKDQELELELDKHFRPLGMSGSGKLSGPVVFAGYAATAKDIKYDDFEGIDATNKVLLIIRRSPRVDNDKAPFDGEHDEVHQALETKIVNSDLHKAAAVLIVNDRATAKAEDKLIPFNYAATAKATGLPAVSLLRSVGDQMLQSSLNISLKTMEEDIDRDLKPRSAALTGWTATLETRLDRSKLSVKNIVGVLEGNGPLADETVVVGAHYDHLGYGGQGSLAKNPKNPKIAPEPEIHPGADDNGSGTAVLMELARRFGKQEKREGRRLVFIAFTAEERGLIGSDYYCKHPLFPLKETVAMVNLDQVGRLRTDKDTKKERLEVFGTSSGKGFSELVDKLNKQHDFDLRKPTKGAAASAFGASDHASFYNQKIPVIFYHTGMHKEYHKPTDTADTINAAGMKKVADITAETIEQLATVKERPEYVKGAAATGHGTGGRFSGPRLGVMPDYSDEKEGLLISSLSEDGPAGKAGIKAGDRIIELGGKTVKDIQTYMVLMSSQKKGESVEVGIMRDGAKMTIKVKLE